MKTTAFNLADRVGPRLYLQSCRAQVSSTHKIDTQLLDFIKQELSHSNGLSKIAGLKKVPSRAVKNNAIELTPDVFGVVPSRDHSYGGGEDDDTSALYR
ncbi:unnamed protein product [Pylaiella littoralis]